MEREDLKCDTCKSSFVDYVQKDGKGWMTQCKDCLAEMLIEEAVDNNNLIELDNLEDEEMEEILKEIEE